MDPNTRENVLVFVSCCKKAKDAFDVWMTSCGEEELKIRFAQMAELLSLLDDLVQKAEKILTGK